MRKPSASKVSRTGRLLPVAGALIVWTLSVFSAGAGTNVVGWGAGTFVDTRSYYNWGQSIVPAGLTNAVLVAGGWRHSLALDADGTLTPWGDDSVGQTDFAVDSNFIAVSCGWIHSAG